MAPKLETRIPSLDAVPEALRDFYAPDPRGGFRLQVVADPEQQKRGQAPAPMDPALRALLDAKSGGKRSAGDSAVDAIVRDAVKAIRPRPEHADAVAGFLRARIRNDGTSDEPSLAFLAEPHGFRLPSALAGTDWAGDVEWRTAVTAQMRPEWLQAAPVEQTEEEAVRADVDTSWRPQKPNVRLPYEHTQAQFEAAHAEAIRRGGIVLIDEEADEPPPPSVANGKDVAVRDGCSQAEFEQAHAIATARGGSVVIVD